jgi:hypothetical protein
MYTSLNMVDRLNFGQKIIYKFRLFPTVSWENFRKHY